MVTQHGLVTPYCHRRALERTLATLAAWLGDRGYLVPVAGTALGALSRTAGPRGGGFAAPWTAFVDFDVVCCVLRAV